MSYSNFNCYSIQNARLILASTQDIDVLLKQICAKLGNNSTNESGYRLFMTNNYPNILTAKVEISMYDLEFMPFQAWSNNITPDWWTANNKIKHERHTHFTFASLQNLLGTVAALFITNLFFYSIVEEDIGVFPGTSFFSVHTLTTGLSPTDLGMVPNYKLP